MAGGKRNEVWIIALLLVVAVVLGVLAFTKEQPRSVTVTSQDMLSETISSSGVKPAHSEADQAAVAAVKPVSSIVLPPQVLNSRDSFAIQVYSFKDKARAAAALEKLKAKGLQSYVMESDLGARGVWYRVRVGSFSTEEEARKVLEVVINEFKNGIIVTE